MVINPDTNKTAAAAAGGDYQNLIEYLETKLVSDFSYALPKLTNKTLLEICNMFVKEVDRRKDTLNDEDTSK